MTTSDIHIQLSTGPALMQPADFLPFANRTAQTLEEVLHSWADKTLASPVYGVLSPRERAEKRMPLVERLRRDRVMYGFIKHHYPAGSVFDYHGVSAMVESSDYINEGRGRTLQVVAVIRGATHGIDRLVIQEKVALALVWRKFGLEEA